MSELVLRSRLVTALSLTAGTLLLSACGSLAPVEGSAKGKVEGASAEEVGRLAPPKRPDAPPVISHCTPAPQLHTQALCVCKDLVVSGALVTHARNGRSADVGVEGSVSLASGSAIAGAVRATGEIGAAGSLKVGGLLESRRDVSMSGELLVTGDLASGGDLVGAGVVDVRGAVRVAGERSVAGSFAEGARAAYVAPATAPCGCAPEDLYDVGAAVEAARTANDDAVVGLDPSGLAHAGARDLELPTGRYWLAGIGHAGALSIRARGNVQLYVAGDLTLAGEGTISLDPGATLDLFVAGSVDVAGRIALGDEARPEAFRLYVGGRSASLSVAGEGAFRGLVYAPSADVSLAGTTTVEGALFAGSLSTAGSLAIGYTPVTTQGERCEHAEATPAPAPTYIPPPELR